MAFLGLRRHGERKSASQQLAGAENSARNFSPNAVEINEIRVELR
jgi:hypothetical protein